MIAKKVFLQDPIGFHARTAALVAKKGAQFQAEIQVEFQEKKANGKSTLALMTLGVKSMQEIKIMIQGPDEQSAMEALVELVESQFKI